MSDPSRQNPDRVTGLARNVLGFWRTRPGAVVIAVLLLATAGAIRAREALAKRLPWKDDLG